MSDRTSNALVFDDLEPICVPVRVGPKDYILREASGDAACKWRNAITRVTRMQDGKVSSVGDIADTEPLLISLCLFEIQRDKDGKPSSDPPVADPKRPVSEKVIRTWPHRVQRALFDKARAISELEEKETAEDLEKKIADLQEKLAKLREGDGPKNGPSATTDGSDLPTS